MKPIRIVLFAAVMATAGSTIGLAQSISAILLTNGFVMKDCTIISWEKDTVTVKFAGGIVPVRYSNIHPKQRAMFEKYRDEQLSQRAANEYQAARAQKAADEQANAQKEAEAARQAGDDRKAEEIKRGVFYHYLVVGMTYDQVREALGNPASSSSTRGDYSSDSWRYPGRGKDVHGMPCDRTVFFHDGRVTLWNDS